LGTGGKLLIALLGVLIVSALAVGGWFLFGNKGSSYGDLLTHKVAYEQLQLTIVERGALESAENRDIVCRVKARTQGNTIATTLKWVIDAGSQVKTGDKLIELDDSGLQEQLKTQKITEDTARSAWIQAEEAYKIGESQNTSDIASAQLKLDLARIALRNYLEGEYEKSKRDIEGRTLMAKSDLEMWEERAAWSERMSRPSRRYVTQAQAESDAARRTSAQISLKNVQEEMRVLEDPNFGTKVQKIKSLQGDIDEAIRALERTIKQAKAKEVQFDADRKSKQSVYDQAVKAREDIEGEIKKCVLYAPGDGLVVYYVPEQSRAMMGAQQSIVAQGEPVREGQKMMRIPDLNKMVVNTKVHEALVSKVRGDVWIPTHFGDAIGLAMLTNPDLLGRVSSHLHFQDGRTAFAEAYKAEEQRLVMDGQRATVRVDAFPTKSLKAHVKTVQTVASQQDWLSADVKVYQTYVSIDEPLPGLKPDMSAEVTIFTDSQRSHVLTMPMQAVVGSVEMGNKRKCYVLTPNGPQEREVELGLSNDKMVEVLSGLNEGDEVVVNPRALMSEKERAAAGAAKAPNGMPEGQGLPPGAGKGFPGGGDPKGGFPGAGGADKKGGFPGAGAGQGFPGGGDAKGGMKMGGGPPPGGKTVGQ
jgi:multidrug efflux pump subunit AcrA (membrane-fusion protein)